MAPSARSADHYHHRRRTHHFRLSSHSIEHSIFRAHFPSIATPHFAILLSSSQRSIEKIRICTPVCSFNALNWIGSDWIVLIWLEQERGSQKGSPMGTILASNQLELSKQCLIIVTNNFPNRPGWAEKCKS